MLHGLRTAKTWRYRAQPTLLCTLYSAFESIYKYRFVFSDMKPNNDLVKAIYFQHLTFTPNFPYETSAGKVRDVG